MFVIKSKKWKIKDDLYEVQLLKCFDGFGVMCLKNGLNVLSQYFFTRKEANKFYNQIKYTEVAD